MVVRFDEQFLPFLDHLELLLEIANVDLDLIVVIAVVDNLEVEPTLMALSMCIYSKVKIVLLLAYFKGEIEVATLKITYKLNLTLLLHLFLFFFHFVSLHLLLDAAVVSTIQESAFMQLGETPKKRMGRISCFALINYTYWFVLLIDDLLLNLTVIFNNQILSYFSPL